MKAVREDGGSLRKASRKIVEKLLVVCKCLRQSRCTRKILLKPTCRSTPSEWFVLRCRPWSHSQESDNYKIVTMQQEAGGAAL